MSVCPKRLCGSLYIAGWKNPTGRTINPSCLKFRHLLIQNIFVISSILNKNFENFTRGFFYNDRKFVSHFLSIKTREKNDWLSFLTDFVVLKLIDPQGLVINFFCKRTDANPRANAAGFCEKITWMSMYNFSKQHELFAYKHIDFLALNEANIYLGLTRCSVRWFKVP